MQDKQKITLYLFPEQYVQLTDKKASLANLLEKSICFYIQLINQEISLGEQLQIVYDSLEQANPMQVLGNDYKAWYRRGILLNGLGRYEEAIASFDLALKLKPELQKAWYKKGIAYYAIDFYEEAIEDFRKALKLDPYDYLSLYSLGKSLLELEAYEEAIASFDRVLAIAKNFNLAKLAKQKAIALANKDLFKSDEEKTKIIDPLYVPSARMTDDFTMEVPDTVHAKKNKKTKRVACS
jgi:tetratricopeptide (TPR) repeat protein